MRGRFVVGPGGAFVTYHADGEVRREVELAAGVYCCATFEKSRLPGEAVDYGQSVLLGTTVSVQPLDFGDKAYQSAANPFFRVTPAMRQVKELQRMLSRSEALDRRVKKGLQAMQRGAAVPAALQLEKPADDSEVPAI